MAVCEGWMLCLACVLAGVCVPGLAVSAEARGDSPITAKCIRAGGFAILTNRLHPGNRIGYRFHEHTPIVFGDVPATEKDAGIDRAATERLEQRYAKRLGVATSTIAVKEEGWVPQKWTFYLAPAADGVDLLLVVETFDVGIASYYGVQQCFRLSGKTNATWRREIAETPAFSEYDLWKGPEKDRSAKTSLTYVPRKGAWRSLPAGESSVGARTPLGVRIDGERTGGKIHNMPKVGAYEALMTDPIDGGLIVRTDPGRTWVCGICWERTSHVTDHHPADCLHSIVNIGGIPPKSKRAVRGKIYWFKGTLEQLGERWRREFGNGPGK